MRTWFILLRRRGGREEFRSCKRETEEEARAEAERMAAEMGGEGGDEVVVADVRPLRGGGRG